jgi:hypothetical protein
MGLAIPIVISACRVYTTPAGTGGLTAAESITASTPPPAQPERMSHCPSVVPGAATLVSETPGGVEVRVTGGSEAVPEIRKRAAFLASAADETRGKHQASGAMNGRFGRCPVVMRNTKLEVRDIPGGAAIVVKPSRPSELAWLRREVEARSAQLAAPKPFGPGLLKACPNAVPGSETTVKNTEQGVEVTVTEATPEGTALIRQRAKELAAAASPTDERCPVSVPNATLLVTDVPSGVSIAVKPKRPQDVVSLRTMVHERARSFEPPAGHTP